jgi:hypothetical protein
MDIKHSLSVPGNYLARLIVKARGIQAKTGVVDPDSGSNPIDDKMYDTKMVVIGDKAYVTRDEAQKQMTVVCKD